MKIQIKVFCRPCAKCINLNRHIDHALRLTKAEATVEHITSLKLLSNYSANPSQCPILVINENVEFVTLVPSSESIAKKLTQLQSGLGAF
ncbi:thioredoxin family protein [Thermoproteota archaeon]